jgi:hypothetical protein
VQQYYSYMQLGKFGEASAMVTKATRNNFLNTHKGPFLSFEFSTIRFDPADSANPQKAEVTVQLETFPFGAVAPVHSPETTAWILEGKAWYLEAPEPHVANFEKLFEGGKQAKPAPPEEAKFTAFNSDMGKLAVGEKGSAVFQFKNIANHPLTLEVSTYCDCLKLTNLKKQYQPGETAELRFTFDSTNYLDDYSQTVFVKTGPGGATIRLLVTGFVLRPGMEKPPEKPEKPEKP